MSVSKTEGKLFRQRIGYMRKAERWKTVVEKSSHCSVWLKFV